VPVSPAYCIDKLQPVGQEHETSFNEQGGKRHFPVYGESGANGEERAFTPADWDRATLHRRFCYTNVAILEDATHNMTVQSITQALQVGLSIVVHEGQLVTSFGDW